MIDDLAALFAYNRWADARVLEACRAVPADRYAAEIVPGWASLRSTINHLAAVADLWFLRFQGESPATFLGDDALPTLEDAARLLNSAQERFERLVHQMTPDRLAAPLTYTNMKGVVATIPTWTALRHVVNHASYHRGQVASKLKRLGVEPPITDFIYWAIEQTPQPIRGPA